MLDFSFKRISFLYLHNTIMYMYNEILEHYMFRWLILDYLFFSRQMFKYIFIQPYMNLKPKESFKLSQNCSIRFLDLKYELHFYAIKIPKLWSQKLQTQSIVSNISTIVTYSQYFYEINEA